MASAHKTLQDVQISYPVREVQQLITSAEYDTIKAFPEHKARMIKFVRDQYKLGLYEAKQIVDTIHAHALMPDWN